MPIYEDHECQLSRQEEEVVKHFIDSGVFIGLRRWIRSWCMISKVHPETGKYFKSHSACRTEEIRHLVHNYNMIHPFSRFNLYWEFYMFLVFTLQFILIPIDASLLALSKNEVGMVRFVLDTLQLADIIKLFFTGYYHQARSAVILQCSKTSKRYLKTFFLVDVISSAYCYTFPLREMQILVVPYKTALPLRTLNRLKILRLPRWLGTLELFRQYMGYSNYLFKGIKVVLIFILVTLWAFSVSFFIEYYIKLVLYDNQVWHVNAGKEILQSYYDATTMLLLVSYGKDKLKEMLEYASGIIFLCFGFALQLFLYAQILQVWTKYASAENKHHSLFKQFKEYMKYKELPLSLRERIFSYFQFKFHKQFFKESDISSMVSPLLKQEILLHVTKTHVERVEFFRHLPENILLKVVAQLRSEIFLPEDVIISAGSPGTSMFFIYHGTVAVYAPNGKEVCHLEDGAHFGEIALILSQTRVATVVAVTASELFMLKRSDFLSAIEPFPEFKEHLMQMAMERLQGTMSHSEPDSA